MDELLNDFHQVENTINSNNKLDLLIKNLFEDGSSAVVMIEDIIQELPYPKYLLHTWIEINTKLQSVETISREEININPIHFYGCLYATMMMEDERLPEDSPVLISLITCLKVAMLKGNNEFTNSECHKVLLVGLKRIHTRDLVGWNISSEFMFECLKAIKIMSMDVTLMNSFINMLMIYAGKHFNMVTNLSLADNESPCGLLAFACLANLFAKNCDDKQTIMETMLESIEHTMEDNAGLNTFQISVKQSNFRVMIRQVGSSLTTCSDQILFALLRVAERHPKSKSLVFIINQLPYSLFCQFCTVVVRLCTRKYYQPMQMFCFNLLESPYITEEEHESQNLVNLYQQISESIVVPLQEFELQPVTETIKLIYAMLQIYNPMVKGILLGLTQHNKVMKELMTYINQYCDSKWNQEYKQMNQYYVSVYCRLLILNPEKWRDSQYRQFTALLLRGNPNDLIPCLKDLRALIASESFEIKEIQVVVLNALFAITKDGNTHSIHFLKVLHTVIFDDLRVGYGYYNLIAIKSPQCDLLLKNMVKSRLITLKDIDNLSIVCKHLLGWRLMCDLSLHMDFPLNKHILHFSEHLHEVREKILQDITINHVIRFFNEILTRKGKTCLKSEKEILMRFSVFLEGILINRLVPINALPVALLTLRKYHTLYNSSLARIEAMNVEVEEKTNSAFKQMLTTHGNFDSINVLTRDLSYFAEMQYVFGDIPQFKPQESTRLNIENGMMYIQNLKKEFPPLAIEMIKCMSKVSIRQDDLLANCIKSLSSLLKFNQHKVKEVCLDAFYDIALFRTSSYEMLLPHIYDLLITDYPLDSVTALNMYAKLFAKEHTIPNEWQTFVIALAVSCEEVTKLMEPVLLETFMEKLNPYFETYFIHFMFYCNDIEDNEDYLLLPDYRNKILNKAFSFERRKTLYCTLIKYFQPECRTKILNVIYKSMSAKYLKPGDLEANGMLQDILLVTYETLKGVDYPELSKVHYEKSLGKIKRLESYTSKKMGNGINADEIIVLVIAKLTKLLYNLNEKNSQLMLKLFHLVFAVIDWNYASIFNAIVDEGMNGKLRKSILKLMGFYKNYNFLFHYVDNNVLTGLEHPIKCSRI